MGRRLGLGGVLAAIALAGCVHVGGRPVTAQVAGVAGRVEVLRPGQAWAPLAAGAALAERDEVRAFPGASAEVRLPDASALFVAENSRVALARLDVTPEGQARAILVYLPVGKVRAVIAEPTLDAVRAGRATFTIATPTTGAGASGTNMVVSFDPAAKTTLVACLPGRPGPVTSPEQCARDEAECGRLAAAAGKLDEAAFGRCMRDRGYEVRTER
jgi:hypothetical protein